MEAMQNDKANKLVPELRFKGFPGSWEKGILNDYAKFYNGKAFKQEELLDAGKYPVLRVGNLFTNNNWYYSDLELADNKIIDFNDLIYAWSATFGPRIWKGERVIYHYHIWKVECNLNIVDKGFYFQILDNETAKMKANSSNGFALLHITKGTIENWNINIPSLPEQQKIASFLSAVDEKIQQLTRKKELLEQFKKGVMQQLFSGKLRFKDENGEDYVDWEEKRLGEVGTIVSGLTYSPDDIDSQGVLVLRSSNIKNRRLSFNDNVYVKTSKYNPIKLNDILICVRNGSTNLIGKNTIMTEKVVGVAFGAFMSIYRSKFNLFIYHYFDTDNYKREVNKNLGATINSINGSDLKKFKIPYPSLSEQQKIANFLSSIDSKIESTAQQINQTQTFKKGLLQKMFC